MRLGVDAYYNYRIAGTQSYLNDLYKQREAAIEKLKAATKYNSTQQLLDKYGGSSPKPSPSQAEKRQSMGGQNKPAAPRGGRTGIAPPPTANIPGRQASSVPSSPQITQFQRTEPVTPVRPTSRQAGTASPTEEFAPNAFSAPLHPPPPAAPEYAPENPRWYDRILDVVLGEDETQPKNRIVLICKNCRLVNGQAPPGTRHLEEVGKWRCSECRTANGSESETSQMIRKVAESKGRSVTNSESGASLGAAKHSAVSDDGETEEMQEIERETSEVPANDGASEEESPPAGSTRSKVRQRRKA